MDEKSINTGWEFPQTPPAKPFFPTGRRELVFGVIALLGGWLLCNSVLYGGFNLGYAIFASLAIAISAVYLVCSGRRLSPYSSALLLLSLVITASFARSDDSFVKFVMLCFLSVSVNLGLCLLAGQNRRSPGSIATLADAGRGAFTLALGKLPESFRGLNRALRKGGSVTRRASSIFIGLLIALPVLCIMIPLLMRADAAFEAVLDLLPDWQMGEFIITAILGTGLALWLYSRSNALLHAPKPAPVQNVRKGISVLTVNTVLTAVVAVYLVYLISQLAYFSGGLSGILPEEFTLAEYARRGFFEMAWLCAVNLTVMALSVGLVAKSGKAPLATRLLCLFIGLVTLFLVVTASAKMLLYISSFGLTRLRVLTEVIMVFLGITTALVTVWLFIPKLPYMKAVLLVGLVLGAAVAWADVDTVVAHYNVTAYQSGRLESIDVSYLGSLGDGAVPYIALLQEDSDIAVAAKARELLQYRSHTLANDFRGWNLTSSATATYLGTEEEADNS